MVNSSQDEDFFASSPPPPPPPQEVARASSPNGQNNAVAGPSKLSPPNPSADKKRSSLFRGDSDDEDDVQVVEPVLARKRLKANGLPKAASGGSSSKLAQDEAMELVDSDADGEQANWQRKYVSTSHTRGDHGRPSLIPLALSPLQIGHFCVAGWSLSKGKGYAEQGARVTIVREKPKQATTSKAAPPPVKTNKKQTKLAFGGGSSIKAAPAASKAAKQKEDYVVRFSNMRGFEVGRLPMEVSSWLSKLIDLDLAEFEGYVIDCPPVLTVGCDVLLDIRAYLKRAAFPADVDVRRSRNLINEPASNFYQETAETGGEKELRQKKIAMIRLFKVCDLKPAQASEMLLQHADEGANFDSNSMLDHFGGKGALSSSSPPRDRFNGKKGSSPEAAIALDSEAEADGDGAATAGDEVNDGTEMEENQMNAVYSKAQKHDAELPEVEPPDSFALQLRPYQKQALGWMQNMEKPAYLRQGREGQRQDASLHPLWQEYKFPSEDEGDNTDEGAFYFNPYIGEMSLQFQPATNGTRGGILADEMGLGKTIMVASLLHANKPDEADEADDDDDGDERAKQVEKKGPRQTSLASAFAKSSQQQQKHVSAGQVTLVVAPMSLVGQWRSELERASQPGTMSIMLYYAEGKADLLDRLEGGSVDVVITSYGTLVSEYKRYIDSGGSSASAKKVAKAAPLYSVDWLRVILDEAHNIRNRTTRNARACHDLVARRRWCLTGSPIVNRLSDLYSLLNFLRVEPWGDFAFFNSFILKPFANKNPKALEIVQIILESVLLRREKKMKDKDGKPIVSLPSKTIDIKHLAFSDIERKIYDLCFDRAWVQYQRLRDDGSVTRNLSIIFSVLMKLRQAVCHPLLVLQAMQASHLRAQEAGQADMDEESAQQVKELVARYQAGQGDGDADGAADAVQDVSDPALADLLAGEDQEMCPACHDPISEPASLPCGDKACRSCLEDALQQAENAGQPTNCSMCNQGPYTVEQITDFAIEIEDEAAPDEPAKPSSQQRRSAFKAFAKDDFRSSTKLDALVADLAELRRQDPMVKGVIFSQFTSFLDLVEVVLKRNSHPFVRLDGTTSQKDREKVMKLFAEAQGHMLILVSLKAGGTGLNMTAASHCWLLDCWWNESTEAQAVDRIHRIGQTRPVTVHRYLIEESVEDRILEIQKRKTALVNAALAGGGSKDGAEGESETVENLRILFGDREKKSKPSTS